MIETHNSLSNPHESNSSKSSRVRLCIRLLSAVMMASARSRLVLLQFQHLFLDRVASDRADRQTPGASGRCDVPGRSPALQPLGSTRDREDKRIRRRAG